MKVSVIICAAGRGERAGFEKNKLLVPMPENNGVCVLEKTVQNFLREDVFEVIVATSVSDREDIEALLRQYPVCKVVLGGETRTKSVQNALSHASGEIVLIHDGARPYVSQKIISDCIESVKKHGSGVCALATTDTVVIANQGKIEQVPERDKVFTVQTPQGFLREEIIKAYEKIGEERYTDDSAVYAKFIRPPQIFLGDIRNKKMTFSEDFQPTMPARVGVGIDTHAFGKQQDFIVLAGVKIPSHSGLVAHSDGDVLIHAVMDALLSAVGLPDIGHYFPDTDEKWKNADSMKMLQSVMQEIKKQGFTPCNISIAVQAEKPKLAKFMPAMTQSLANALSLPLSAVGITAGTAEGLGFVGEGKGITVTANVLLKEI
ncbi:MAG: 2-C-methyl-D-erythritol 2,4-cyclodiphosphate synthase [Clostridia bacterium]|nr:2-C-methyl-D-erythritol 2,4-cyclodiphosphate synthase [Clostridia bacterium]